jgi:hypothetical protein
MKAILIILLLLAALNSMAQSDSTIQESKRFKIETKVLTIGSVAAITAGGNSIMNGDLPNGLFLLTAGTLFQLAAIIIDLDRPKAIKKKK